MTNSGRVAFTLAAALCVGCGGNSGAPSTVSSVTVSPSQVSVEVRNTQFIEATVRDASGAALSNRTVAWSTNNAGVATVSSSGGVTGVSAGQAMITATSEGKSGTAQVTVTPPAPVNTVLLTGGPAVIRVGTSTTLSVSLRDAADRVLSGRDVAWTTGDASIATVSSSGEVTGVSAGGPVTITATSEGKRALTQVTVLAPPQPVPVELRGTWHGNVPGDLTPATLVITEGTYSVSHLGETPTTGFVELVGSGGVRFFTTTLNCSGIYSWRITGNTLQFIAGDQDCTSRRTEILTSIWTR